MHDHTAVESKALIDLLGKLCDAIAQSEALGPSEVGNASPLFSNLSPHARKALTASPAQLARTCRAARDAVEVTKVAVSGFLRHISTESAAIWFKP